MKKFLIAGLTILLVGGSILFAKRDDLMNTFAKQAYGVIAYGTADQIESSKKIANEKDLEWSFDAHIKIVDDIAILKGKDVEILSNKGFISKVTEEQNIISFLNYEPTSDPIYWGKSEKTTFENNGKTLNLKYGGNNIIGFSHTYAKSFIIVDEITFEKISGTDKMLVAFQFNDNPKYFLNSFSFEQIQLTDIHKK